MIWIVDIGSGSHKVHEGIIGIIVNDSYIALVYFRDPLPYIPGSYHKTATFVIENNVSPLKYLINIMRQVSYNKNDTLYGECPEPPTLHKGIHVHCRTVWSVVNCWIRYNDLCCRLCKIFCFVESVCQA
jgi:hypothetical protein